MIRQPLAFIVAAAMIAGCAPFAAPYAMPAPVGAPLEVVDTAYTPTVTIKGPQTVVGNYYGVPEMSWRLLSSFDKKDKIAQHGIAFVNRYGGTGWRFWQNATNSHAERLDVHVGDRSVGTCGPYTGCSHTEQIVAFMSTEQVAVAAQSGLSVMIRSKHGGSVQVDFSADDVRQQLATFVEATASYR